MCVCVTYTYIPVNPIHQPFRFIRMLHITGLAPCRITVPERFQDITPSLGVIPEFGTLNHSTPEFSTLKHSAPEHDKLRNMFILCFFNKN